MRIQKIKFDGTIGPKLYHTHPKQCPPNQSYLTSSSAWRTWRTPLPSSAMRFSVSLRATRRFRRDFRRRFRFSPFKAVVPTYRALRAWLPFHTLRTRRTLRMLHKRKHALILNLAPNKRRLLLPLRFPRFFRPMRWSPSASIPVAT